MNRNKREKLGSVRIKHLIFPKSGALDGKPLKRDDDRVPDHLAHTRRTMTCSIRRRRANRPSGIYPYTI